MNKISRAIRCGRHLKDASVELGIRFILAIWGVWRIKSTTNIRVIGGVQGYQGHQGYSEHEGYY